MNPKRYTTFTSLNLHQAVGILNKPLEEYYLGVIPVDLNMLRNRSQVNYKSKVSVRLYDFLLFCSEVIFELKLRVTYGT